jgi:hypothetical protein
MVNWLKKFAYLFSISSEYKETQVEKLFFKKVFKLHGMPKCIVSDRDSRFLHSFWKEICRLDGTNLTPNTSYHPQTYGQIDIVNKWLE